MELKVRKEHEESVIFVSFINSNVMCKFIDERLYPHLYKTYSHIFEEVKQEPVVIKKTKLTDDISIDIRTKDNNSSI